MRYIHIYNEIEDNNFNNNFISLKIFENKIISNIFRRIKVIMHMQFNILITYYLFRYFYEIFFNKLIHILI